MCSLNTSDLSPPYYDIFLGSASNYLSLLPPGLQIWLRGSSQRFDIRFKTSWEVLWSRAPPSDQFAVQQHAYRVQVWQHCIEERVQGCLLLRWASSLHALLPRPYLPVYRWGWEYFIGRSLWDSLITFAWLDDGTAFCIAWRIYHLSGCTSCTGMTCLAWHYRARVNMVYNSALFHEIPLSALILLQQTYRISTG